MESLDHAFSVVLGPMDHDESYSFTHEGTRQYLPILDDEMAHARTLEEAKDMYRTVLSIANEALPQSDGDHHKLKQYALARLQLWKESVKRNYEAAMQNPSVN